MNKIAFIFPGQGAQYVGMAKDFYENYEVSRDVFVRASSVVNFEDNMTIEELCFKEENKEKINETKYTQPALLTASSAILAAVEAEGIHAQFTAGLSLGEYNALVAAKAMTLEEAVSVVCKRGIYMDNAVPHGFGGMTAIVSKKPLNTEKICEEVSNELSTETEHIVTVANYNCPGQQVISGEKNAVNKAAERLVSAGAFRAVPLKVSGPFHSPLLKEAGTKLEELLSTKTIKNPEIAFISNVTAKPVENPEDIRRLLGQQVYSSVRWQQSVEYMISQGVDTFIEIGPGKTLSNLVKKIHRNITVFNIEKVEDLKNLKNA